MNTTKVIRIAMLAIVGVLALNTLAADPTISDVVARQRWPWSQLVDIDYVLTCDATQRVDVVLTAKDGSTTLALPSESLSGDLYGVTPGMKRVIFDPFKTAYTNSQMLTQFSVTLVPTITPVYMIVDLTKAAGASGQIEYIYPGDARLETYGRFTNVWFGVTNDSIYATDLLVLRRVHAGTFSMGDSAVSTTLSKDFYVGVFEVTDAQWQRISTGTGGTSLLAKSNVSYNGVRGATNSVPPINWYTTGSAVSSASFLGQIRAKTGIGTFDLPTEAQWEYFCRAGTTSYYNDGVSVSADTSVLNRLGWWSGNSGGTVHAVGGKEANAWGLYDTHGNVWEMCLDWYADSLTGGSDPAGVVSGADRVRRGASWITGDTPSCRSAVRLSVAQASIYAYVGLRLVVAMP